MVYILSYDPTIYMILDLRSCDLTIIHISYIWSYSYDIMTKWQNVISYDYMVQC
jgi:hypothetical protein